MSNEQMNDKWNLPKSQYKAKCFGPAGSNDEDISSADEYEENEIAEGVEAREHDIARRGFVESLKDLLKDWEKNGINVSEFNVSRYANDIDGIYEGYNKSHRDDFLNVSDVFNAFTRATQTAKNKSNLLHVIENFKSNPYSFVYDVAAERDPTPELQPVAAPNLDPLQAIADHRDNYAQEDLGTTQ